MHLHGFCDANLASPKEHDYMADNAKSFTGIVVLFAGAAIMTVATRQHLKSPCAHTAEITAASSAHHLMLPISGVCQELSIPQEQPVVIYCDSQSTVFVATNPGAVKRSVWVLRRAAVLAEGVRMGDICIVKIGEADNIADGCTKPIKRETWQRHFQYLYNMDFNITKDPGDISEAALIMARGLETSPTTPMYHHEDVTEVEVGWQCNVPKALALCPDAEWTRKQLQKGHTREIMSDPKWCEVTASHAISRKETDEKGYD